jgi:guanosine-3',5'-bis(diphosphate) 3'-pyrophosphohydrolase
MADSLDRIRKRPRAIWCVKMADRITNLAPPPGHWPHGKIVAYCDEARAILDALRNAHAVLAARLEQNSALSRGVDAHSNGFASQHFIEF